MKALLVIMTGIGFTLGVVLGLLLHLPSDSLPADHGSLSSSSMSEMRHKRNVNAMEIQVMDDSGDSSAGSNNGYDVIAPIHFASDEKIVEGDSINKQEDARSSNISADTVRNNPPINQRIVGKQNSEGKQGMSAQRSANIPSSGHGHEHNPSFEGRPFMKQDDEINGINKPREDIPHSQSISHSQQTGNDEMKNDGDLSEPKSPSREDVLYLESIVNGVLWTDKLEKSCPRAFTSTRTESWRKRSETMDVVKMEEGCGRMQNRLVTFRDASKACARYRLNTDQIQGEIFSYYLAKLLDIPNLPPTSLSLVNSADKKWRTVHLDLSLAQWADSKLVVLTQFIEGLDAAHIPVDFRPDHRKLHPILEHIGSKTHDELCELMQWSDLIVFDYLTANLDRVINNMFNRQWNDQIMDSPAHNLEKFKNGNLVFLDNESGLFHGFRLIEKYEILHRSLLDSLCIFRASTASTIKRLASSNSIGAELKGLLQQHEPLHRHVPNMPQKNVKILQQRINQVNEQISICEKKFNR